MRVLLTVAAMTTGGAERVVVGLARGLVEAGVDVGVAAAPGELDAELPSAVDRFHFADRRRSALGLAEGTVALARATRVLRPDVIHAHNVRATALSVAGARLAHPWSATPVLGTYHGVVPAEEAHAGRVLARASALTCVSADLAARLKATGASLPPTSVVPNAIEPAPAPPASDRAALRAELGLPEGAPVVASISRLAPQKALHQLLAAFPAVLERISGARLLIVGEGPERPRLEALAEDLGLRTSVTFLGLRHDVPRILAVTDVLAISSDWEGQPIVALEALAAGVPIVSTDVSGMGELLATGAGRIVPVADPAALGEALGAALADDAGRARMSAAGRELVATRHAPSSTVAAYRTLYARLKA